jgi:hypothetical protein
LGATAEHAIVGKARNWLLRLLFFYARAEVAGKTLMKSA